MGNGLIHSFNTSNTFTETSMIHESQEFTNVELEVELTTRQAAERYGCENNYSTFHNRMAKLGIKPERRGRSSFLRSNQIELLDRLDFHLKSGGTFSNFVIETGEVKSIPQNNSVVELATTTNSSIATTGSIGDMEIIAALKALSQSNYDILTPQKRLKEAADEQFLLTTDQVSKILGLSHSTISSWKSGTRKLGFSFTKHKEGTSVVWEVSR